MKYFYFILVMLVMNSCVIEPQPIAYNYDECAFCKMKISDPRFGAELVSSKGKIYKYDSAECLVRTYLEEENKTWAFALVTNYTVPKTLIDAKSATYLISENQPSPMGGNLSAYQDSDAASSVQSIKGGELLTFDKLLDEYRSKN